MEHATGTSGPRYATGQAACASWDPWSDAYRTAAVEARAGFISVGMKLHTGDWTHDRREIIDGKETRYFVGGDIDDPSQSHGILYLGLGELQIGADSEGIRHVFQNRVAHDGFFGLFSQPRGHSYPWVLRTDRKPKLYLQWGAGSGNSLY